MLLLLLPCCLWESVLLSENAVCPPAPPTDEEADAGSDEPGAKRLRTDHGGQLAAEAAAVAAADAAAAEVKANGDAAMEAAAAAFAAPIEAGDPAAAAAAMAAAAAAAAGQLPGGAMPAMPAIPGMPLPLDPAAAAALGLTAEQQAQMQQLMQFPLGLSPEALAAAGATLPAGPDGQPLPLTLPIIGGDLPQLALDPSALNIPILGPDGAQLTPEQLMQLFSQTSMPFVIPLAAGQAPVSFGPDGQPVYKNWWDEKDEKVSRAPQGLACGGLGICCCRENWPANCEPRAEPGCGRRCGAGLPACLPACLPPLQPAPH